MTWDRNRRQEAILREKIAVIVLERLNDPRLGFVTITEATLSRDKRYCTVKYTVMGTDAERSRSSRALNDAAPRVRELLAPTLHTRVLPELRFEYDEVVRKETHLRSLIEEVTAERLARTGEPDDLSEFETDADVDGEETGGSSSAEPDQLDVADAPSGAAYELSTDGPQAPNPAQAGLQRENEGVDDSEDEGADGRP